MEDIIFTGTESRKPLSLAEVSITIDNTNRVLSLDSDAVTVTRRVFARRRVRVSHKQVPRAP